MAQNKLKISMFIKGINSLFSYNIKEKSKKGGGDIKFAAVRNWDF